MVAFVVVVVAVAIRFNGFAGSAVLEADIRGEQPCDPANLAAVTRSVKAMRKKKRRCGFVMAREKENGY